MTAPLLLCDCYLDTPGAARNFLPLLSDHNVEVARPAHERWAARARDYVGIVISGSAASIVAPPTWEAPLETLVREAADDDVPVLGVCFGHQVIARAMVGPSAVTASVQPELGWYDVRHHGGDPLLAGLDASFRTFMSHREEVVADATGLQVLASSDACVNQAFRVAGRRMWGVQFHAEIAEQEARELVHKRAASGGQHIDLGTTLARAVESTHVAQRIMDNFLGALSP